CELTSPSGEVSCAVGRVELAWTDAEAQVRGPEAECPPLLKPCVLLSGLSPTPPHSPSLFWAPLSWNRLFFWCQQYWLDSFLACLRARTQPQLFPRLLVKGLSYHGCPGI
ncbi:mCG145422, partial [Mus musculus]